MNLDLDDSELAFRDEVRSFFAGCLPAAWRARVRAGIRLEPAECIAYQKSLAERGWGAPTWPREFGGTGWTPTQQYLFESEASRADAPVQFHQGLELIGPILFTYGSAQQKAKYLPRIISADDWWCQGYSEPGAGSDLASLRTRAVRDGDSYVITGQKTWTSYAHVASHMFILARTSEEKRKQSGISLLLMDMTTPGITVRPIDSLDERHHVNEVYLDDVRVPVGNLVGEEGNGWSYGKVLLDRERGVTSANALRLPQQLRAVREAASRARSGGRPLIEERPFRARLAQLEIETIGIEAMVMSLMSQARSGPDSGPGASMIKLRWSDLLQRVTELWVEVLGYDAAVFRPIEEGGVSLPVDMPHAMQGALYARVTSIYGGSSEIQRNIIARRWLGL
jgi:alkylation response protein AidB-like acyl-CoA dehydrogenase